MSAVEDSTVWAVVVVVGAQREEKSCSEELSPLHF